MQGAVSLRSSASASGSRFSDGIPPTSSVGFWPPKNQVSYANSKTTALKSRLSEGSCFGRTARSLKVLTVRADATANGSYIPIAPIRPESPTGQFLMELLQIHPHLVSAAAEQQLEKMAEDRDAAIGHRQSSRVGAESVLYKRIAELKAQERRKALEDIIYVLIVQRFLEVGVSMVLKIPCSFFPWSPGKLRLDRYWTVLDTKLESVHSNEALEMIQEHLALVMGGKSCLDHTFKNAHISKMHTGQVYAASIMYGYFLRRVDPKFQLEKITDTLSGIIEAEQQAGKQGGNDYKNYQRGNLMAEVAAAVVAMVGMESDVNSAGFVQPFVKSSKLRAYVMSFDPETLHRCATIRSLESVSVIEKQTEALFGRPQFQIAPDGSITIVNDEMIVVSISGLRRLVLEAVAFGTFLCDVETYVDSYYDVAAY